MTVVHLGNQAVLEPHKPDPDSDTIEHRDREDLGQQVTTVQFPDDLPLAEQLIELRALWVHHSGQPPTWVDSDNEQLRDLAAQHFGARAGRPRGWKEGETS